jgi:hypothetical protein
VIRRDGTRPEAARADARPAASGLRHGGACRSPAVRERRARLASDSFPAALARAASVADPSAGPDRWTRAGAPAPRSAPPHPAAEMAAPRRRPPRRNPSAGAARALPPAAP